MNPEFLDAMFATAPFAVITADNNLIITSWNHHAERVFGASAKERIGSRLVEVVPEDRRMLAEKMMKRAMERGRSAEFDVRLPLPNGQVKYLSMVLGAVKGPDDHPLGLVAWVRDRTRRVDMDRQFHKAERMRALVKMAGGVAHHFSNLLAGILTAVDFALTSDSPGAIRKALQRASAAVQKASTLTENLLAFSEMDRRGHDMANLADVVSSFVSRQAGPLTERGIELKLTLPPEPPPYVVDGRRFEIVLSNLVANATEAMKDKGTIEIVMEVATDNILVSVLDTGEGIPEENMDKLFEPFFTTKGLLGGGEGANVGLGLSVVYGIVTEIGAQLSVKSKVGVGTRVNIRFPLRKTTSADVLPPIQPPAVASPSQEPPPTPDVSESATFLIPVPNTQTPAPNVRTGDPHEQSYSYIPIKDNPTTL